jgi:integrase/recombinase XerD
MLMIENGAGIRFTQPMLGHEDIKTTQIYTQVAIRVLKQIHAATHPAQVDAAPQDARSAVEREGLLAARHRRQRKTTKSRSEFFSWVLF